MRHKEDLLAILFLAIKWGKHYKKKKAKKQKQFLEQEMKAAAPNVPIFIPPNNLRNDPLGFEGTSYQASKHTMRYRKQTGT